MKEIFYVKPEKYQLTCGCGCIFSFDKSDIIKEGVCDISYRITCPRCGQIIRSYYKEDLLKHPV